MDKLRATVDTNIAPLDDLIERATAVRVELAIATPTDRELASHSIGSTLDGVDRILETAVWDESQFDNCVLAGDEDADVLEGVLKIISNGSFPKPANRGALSKQQRNQLRDAMIFSAHVRERRDIFVTLDAKAFLGGGRKQKLESTYNTRIMLREEFSNYLASRAAI